MKFWACTFPCNLGGCFYPCFTHLTGGTQSNKPKPICPNCRTKPRCYVRQTNKGKTSKGVMQRAVQAVKCCSCATGGKGIWNCTDNAEQRRKEGSARQTSRAQLSTLQGFQLEPRSCFVQIPGKLLRNVSWPNITNISNNAQHKKAGLRNGNSKQYQNTGTRTSFVGGQQGSWVGMADGLS